jgi:hypothetical protein
VVFDGAKCESIQRQDGARRQAEAATAGRTELKTLKTLRKLIVCDAIVGARW